MTKSRFRPRPLKEQTIVITGASSGIGLATARLAAQKGAKVVMGARNQEALKRCAAEIEEAGGQVLPVTMDVSNKEDLEKLASAALNKFGSIDTWINNAGTSIYGYLLEADIEEERKLFETNFWGARIGSNIAVEAMREKGGTLINIGSEVSSASQPLMGSYSASKHALKAFTDALRSELREREIPVEVSLVRPTAIDTPFAEHAANRLDEGAPSLPAPVYEAKIAAEAILKCAVLPQRDVYVGGPARLAAILDTFFPAVKDIYAESQMKELRKGTLGIHEESKEGLHHPSEGEGKVKGASQHKPHKGSLYPQVTTLSVLKSLTTSLKDSLRDMKNTH